MRRVRLTAIVIAVLSLPGCAIYEVPVAPVYGSPSYFIPRPVPYVVAPPPVVYAPPIYRPGFRPYPYYGSAPRWYRSY